MPNESFYDKSKFKKVKAKKYLGQHFLNDLNIAKNIADAIDQDQISKIVEIGPGTGVLTQFLITKPLPVIAFEIDKESIDYLNTYLVNDLKPNLKIIQKDFLKADLTTTIDAESFGIIGNFPYNISSQILFKTLENRNLIPQLVGMFQKEVAQRICSSSGNKTYGILSVLTQAFYHTDYLFTVKPEVFNPPPKVDSGVIKLTRRKIFHLNCDEKMFFKVVKTAFQQRRKTLRNSLKTFNLSDNLKAEPIFAKRPEQLDYQDFVELTNKIEQHAV